MLFNKQTFWEQPKWVEWETVRRIEVDFFRIFDQLLKRRLIVFSRENRHFSATTEKPNGLKPFRRRFKVKTMSKRQVGRNSVELFRRISSISTKLSIFSASTSHWRRFNQLFLNGEWLLKGFGFRLLLDSLRCVRNRSHPPNGGKHTLNQGRFNPSSTTPKNNALITERFRFSTGMYKTGCLVPSVAKVLVLTAPFYLFKPS